jgi:TonB-linked SusC/RagA family outer membrane protein
MQFRHYLLSIPICFISIHSLQGQIIRGSVVDSTNGDPLIGATIVEIDENNRFLNGTVADVNGNFNLKVSSDEVKLGFSYIGYRTKEMVCNTSVPVRIALSPQTQVMEEVRVVAERTNAGDGLTNIAVRDLATSVSTIEMNELDELPTSSVAEALQGRISGVDITSTSGDPGAGMSIKIRGNTSLNGNSRPLIVLDGVPYETTIGTDFNFLSADVADYGSLVDISPADIRSIQILKDAASTAVWGSKGANGVVVINTKRGRAKQTQFSLDYRTSLVFEPKSLPMLNGDQYVRLMLDERFNRNPVGITDIPIEYLDDPSFVDYYNYNRNTDWVDAVTRNGYTNDLNFAVAGGGDKARYRASVGYYNQLGTMISTSLKRITTRLNLDYTISNKLKLSSDFSYTNSFTDQNYFDGDWNNRDRQVRALAYRKAPHMSIYEYDQDGNPTGNYFSPEQSEQGTGDDYPNPVALAMDGINNNLRNRILTNFLLQYELLPGLRWSGNVSFDINSKTTSQLYPQSATGVQMGNTDLNKTRSWEDLQNVIQTFNKLIYTPKLGDKHDLMLMGMFSTYDRSAYEMGLSTAGIPSYNLSGPSNQGINDQATSGRSRIRTLSYLASAHYILLDRYILDAGIRVDGDSRFGPNHKYGNFPSLSAAWRISSESFMSGFTWLSDLKFRTSYGVNGYATQGSYAYLAKYESATGYIGMNGIQLANIELNNLKWETTTQVNYGADLSLFAYRVTVNFDYYDKLTRDIIFNNLEIPSTSGFSSMTGNWGAITNRGWELNVNANPVKKSEFLVNVSFNISRNRNIIEEIPDNYSSETVSVENGEYARRIQVGDPIGTFYGFRYLGVFSTPEDAVAYDAEGNVIINPETGDPLPYLINGTAAKAGDAIYDDINHDGNIDELDIVYLGDANPVFFGGFGIIVVYRKLTLNTYFNYKLGQDVINETRMYTENMYTSDNQSTAVLRRWRKNGDVTDIPRAVYKQNRNWLGSDRFVEDASFLRMKSLTLSYNFTSGWTKKIGLQSLKGFITAYNILTLTDYTGQDPEVGFNGTDPFAVGRDRSRTPPPVSITAGLNMIF